MAYFGCDLRDDQITAEAKAAGICHTREECAAFYASIPAEKKEPALKYLREHIPADDLAKIQRAMEAHPGREWLWHLYDEDVAKLADEEKRYAPILYNPHHGFGMAVRNSLRGGGFGEEYFDCHNLDDIYVELMTDAWRP